MKKLYIFLFLLFIFNINAYQPPEFDIFLNNFQEKKIEKAPSLGNIINLKREKRSDGSSSYVYIVNNLIDFLYCVNKQNLPVIINFYLENNEHEAEFQEIADNYINKFMFISIDSLKDQQLNQLLFAFLRFDASFESSNKIKYPLVMFCEHKSILLENGLIYFKKGGLKSLIKAGFFDKNKISQKLAKIYGL